MKRLANHAMAWALFSQLACSQGSELKGGTNTASVEKKPVVEESNIEPVVPKADDALPSEPVTLETPVIPGEPTRTVGVNFEDNYNAKNPKANDFNDAVLCFEGTFNITPERKIISTSDQTIKSKTFSDAGCKQKLEIIIVSADGTRNAQTVLPDNKNTEEGEISLSFKKGDALEVNMIPVGPFPCADDVPRKHTDELYSQVDKTCNNFPDRR